MRVGILGLGLIGGSLGLALRRAGHGVVGYDTVAANAQRALARGAVDALVDAPGGLGGAEVVVVAVPLGSLVSVCRDVSGKLPASCILTDTGSVKGPVCGALAGREGPAFVGGHPMFGTEHSGIDAADGAFVQGATQVLTPTSGTPPEAVARLRSLWSALGMQVVELAPDMHDVQLARVSHLPQLLAYALCLQPGNGACAGPSFRDGTRVAMSRPELLLDLLEQNAGALDAAVAALEQTLDQLRAASRQERATLLERARALRLELQTRFSGERR